MVISIFCKPINQISIVEELEAVSTEIKKILMRNNPTASAAAVLSFAYMIEEKYDRALPLARYAIGGLAKKDPVTPIAGIFTFIAGYSAGVILEKLGPSYFKQMKDDEPSPRLFARSKEIVMSAVDLLSQHCAVVQPCLTGLRDALYCKYFSCTDQLREIASVSNIISKIKKAPTFSEFAFALAFINLELANLLNKLDITMPSWKVFGSVDSLAELSERHFSKLLCPVSTYSELCGEGLNKAYFSYLFHQDVDNYCI